MCPSVSAPFLRPRLLSLIACALPRRHSRLAVPVSSRSRIIVGVVPLGPCPYRAHPAAPPSASAPRPSCRAPHPHCAHRTPPASPSLALRRQRGPGWQESRRMHPFFAECAKKAPSLAISARNACFSRSRWQDPRPMCPFPGAIGRFGMHTARILPSRPPFRVEGPEIIHDAKMLPALPDLSRRLAAGRGSANWPNGLCALRPGPGPLAACAGLCHLVRPAATRARGPPPIAAIRTSAPHPSLSSLTRPHSLPPPFTSRPPCPPRCEPSDATRHIVHRSRGGWRAAATRARGPPPIAAIRPRAPRLHACQAAVTRRAAHRGRGGWAADRASAHTRLAPSRRHSRPCPPPAPRGLRRGSRNSREIVR